MNNRYSAVCIVLYYSPYDGGVRKKGVREDGENVVLKYHNLVVP